MNKLRSLALLATTLTGCIIGQGDGTSDEDIIGGAADTVHTSVVQIRYNQVQSDGSIGLLQCTGTVIGPTTILTAGHCAPNGAFHYQYNPSPSASPADFSTPGWIDAGYAAHPWEFDGNPYDGHDVSVLKLFSPTSLAPVALGGAPAVGSVVTASGYGLEGFGSGSYGTRMMVDMTVNSVDEITFAAGVDGHGTCHGDSGGPAFQNGVIVGTVSYGDTVDCHNSNHFARVDDNLDFINQMLVW